MKIQMNTIYHLPTQELEDSFLKQADEQGLTWGCSHLQATKNKQWSRYKGEHCISVRNGALDGWCDKSWYERNVSLPIIKWEIESKFQVGDKVKYVPQGAENPTPFYGTVTRRYSNEGCTDSADGYQYDIRDANGKLEWGWAQEMELDERSEKMESKFKVGDTVKITKENIAFDRPFVGKTAKVREIFASDCYYLEGIELHMQESQLELVEEPKPTPKYKVGDYVKVIEAWSRSDREYEGKVAKVVEVVDDNLYELENVKYDNGKRLLMIDGQLELAEEPKPLYQTYVMGNWGKPEVKFKVGDYAKVVKAIVPIDEQFIGKTAKITEIRMSGEFKLEGMYLRMYKEQLELATEPKPEPKYPQIEDFFGDKVVFNPPYTIVTCNLTHGPHKGKQLIGKAKCNPEDIYDKWAGFRLAHERMRESKPCSR